MNSNQRIAPERQCALTKTPICYFILRPNFLIRSTAGYSEYEVKPLEFRQFIFLTQNTTAGKIVGRMPFLAIDSLGLLWALIVTVADEQDRWGGPKLVEKLHKPVNFILNLWGDRFFVNYHQPVRYRDKESVQ